MICAKPGDGLHNFFLRIFNILVNSIFSSHFFSLTSTGDAFSVNSASGTMDITLSKDFANCCLHFLLNSL